MTTDTLTPALEMSEAQKMVRDSRDFAEKRLKPLALKLDEEEAIPSCIWRLPNCDSSG